MPTPHFTFRLAPEKAAALRQMAKVFESPTPSEFLREMVGAMCSNDRYQVTMFIEKLMTKIAGQLTLELTAPLKILEAPQPAKKRPTARKRARKGGKVRDRS